MLPLIESGYSMYGGIRVLNPVQFWIVNQYGLVWIAVALFAVAVGAVGAVIYLVQKKRLRKDLVQLQAASLLEMNDTIAR